MVLASGNDPLATSVGVPAQLTVPVAKMRPLRDAIERTWEGPLQARPWGMHRYQWKHIDSVLMQGVVEVFEMQSDQLFAETKIAALPRG